MAKKRRIARLKKRVLRHPKVKKVTKKAKTTTQKTTKVTGEKIKSLSDQVVGTKEHGVEEVTAPRITNDSVAEHREQVLAEARRFIYPLHSRRRIVITSISIVLGLIAMTIILTGLMLYKFQSTSGFAYNISKLVPFPIARVDGRFVSYEQYLFEVRSSLYYLSNFTQEGVEIDSPEGQELIKETKRRILDKVQVDAVGYQLAKENGIEVSDEEIDEQIHIFEVRGGIDQSEGTLENVLAKYYDWDIKDLRRVVEHQLIKQKLLPILDEDANAKINTATEKLQSGMSFSDAVKQYSEDQNTAKNGGKVGKVTRDDTNLSNEALDAIFGLEEDQYSQPIALPNGYYIFYINDVIDESTVDVSQLVVYFFDLNTYLSDRLDHLAHRAYITIE